MISGLWREYLDRFMRSLITIWVRGSSLRSLWRIRIRPLCMISGDWHDYRGWSSMMTVGLWWEVVVDETFVYSVIERIIFEIIVLPMTPVDWHGYRGWHYEGMMTNSCLLDDIIDYSTVERVIFYTTTVHSEWAFFTLFFTFLTILLITSLPFSPYPQSP